MEQEKIDKLLQTGIICFRLTTENAFHAVMIDFKEYRSICGLNLENTTSKGRSLELHVCQKRYEVDQKYEKLKGKLTEEQLDFISYYAMTKNCIKCLENQEKNFCSLCAENLLQGLKLLKKDCKEVYKTLFPNGDIFNCLSGDPKPYYSRKQGGGNKYFLS